MNLEYEEIKLKVKFVSLNIQKIFHENGNENPFSWKMCNVAHNELIHA